MSPRQIPTIEVEDADYFLQRKEKYFGKTCMKAKKGVNTRSLAKQFIKWLQKDKKNLESTFINWKPPNCSTPVKDKGSPSSMIIHNISAVQGETPKVKRVLILNYFPVTSAKKKPIGGIGINKDLIKKLASPFRKRPETPKPQET